MRNHEFSNPFLNIGESDLTSHVDFAALRKTIADHKELETTATTQGEFLLEIGLLQRAGMLGSNKSTDIQEQISGQVERLAGPEQMGDLFKVFAFATVNEPLLGFSNAS